MRTLRPSEEPAVKKAHHKRPVWNLSKDKRRHLVLLLVKPSWAMGQLEWTTNGNFVRDDRCHECGEALPPWRKKFCGDDCQRKSDNARAHQRWIQNHVARSF